MKLAFFICALFVFQQTGGCGGCNPPPGSGQLIVHGGNNQSTVINTPFSSPLQVQWLNPDGFGVNSQPVTFTIEPDPVTGAGGSFAPTCIDGSCQAGTTTIATTDGGSVSDGVATTVAITANGKAGQFKVIASVPTTLVSIPATFTLTNTAGAAVAIKATGGTPQSATVSTVFGTPLQALATDSQGNAIPGVSVTFTAPSSGASGTFANGMATETDVSNAKGVASSSVFTANATAGAYSVVGSAPGVSPPASFALTNTNASVQPAKVIPGPAQSASINAAFGLPITATVEDGSGNPLSGYSVTFAAPTAGASGTFANGQTSETDITGTNGVASSSTFTANATLGSYQITAGVAGGALSTAINLTNAATVSVASVSRYVFEINESAVSVYAVWPSTGQLRSLNYFVPSQYNAFGSAAAGALHPNGKTLYLNIAGLSVGSSLWALDLGPNGLLTQKTFATFNNSFQFLTCDPLGRFLYASDPIGGAIDVFPLDPTLATPGTPTPAVAGGIMNPQKLVIDPTGSYLFALNSFSFISMYQINPSTGALTLIGTPQSVGSSSTSLTLSPNGANLYALAGSSVYTYSVNGTTGLAPLLDSPFLIPNAGSAIQAAVDPSGKFFYVTASDNAGLSGFSIDSTGALSPLSSSPFSSGQFPSQINVDPSGHYVYVTNDSDTWEYSLDGSTGALTQAGQIRTMGPTGSEVQLLSTGSQPLTFTPTALYVVNSGSSTVSQFGIDASSGALNSLSAPLSAIASPAGIAIPAGGSFAYVGQTGTTQGVDSSVISLYGISNDVLTPIGLGSAIGIDALNSNNTAALTFDLSGTFLYDAGPSLSLINEFAITVESDYTSPGTAATGASPVFITTEPSGQYIYLANSGSGTIGAYSISLPNGGLAPIGNGSGVSAGTGTNWIAVDPSGRFLYATAGQSNTLQEFLINASNGLPVVNSNPFLPVGPSGATGGGSPGSVPGASAVVVEPSGKYAYASNALLNQIFAYTIDPSTGLLSSVQTSMPNSEAADTGTTPVELAIDISGQYLYCVNSGSNDINIFKIDLTTGLLTPVGTSRVPTGGTIPAGLTISGTVN
jgi:6-phosphogluconolactonase (cycloisomerase 2 family)